jgi:hypothetical protein
MKPLVFAILLASTIARAATETSRDGSTEDRAIIMQGPIISFEATAFRIIGKRYPDAKRPPVRRAVTFDGRIYIARVVFDTASHVRHTMYFDITHDFDTHIPIHARCRQRWRSLFSLDLMKPGITAAIALLTVSCAEPRYGSVPLTRDRAIPLALAEFHGRGITVLPR